LIAFRKNPVTIVSMSGGMMTMCPERLDPGCYELIGAEMIVGCTRLSALGRRWALYDRDQITRIGH
jgi:hypothetical protein